MAIGVVRRLQNVDTSICVYLLLLKQQIIFLQFVGRIELRMQQASPLRRRKRQHLHAEQWTAFS